MPRIGFFMHSEWALGALHRGLEKVLYKHGIYSNLFDWNREYSLEDKNAISKLYDYFVTVPGNPVQYLESKLGIEPERMIVVAHGRQDISSGLLHNNPFHRFYKFAAVSPDVVRYAYEKGIRKGMSIAYNGIHFDYFYNQPASSFNMFGYSGAIRSQTHEHENFKDIKRGYMCMNVSQKSMIPFAVPSSSERHFLAMPEFYTKIDALMVTSTEESCCLPMMEAACAGRATISTPVGVARDYQRVGFPGIVLPMEEDLYTNEAAETLKRFKEDPAFYQRKCRDMQDFAKAYFDWEVRVDDWVKLLS
jgi:hypothetical protein